MVSTFTIVALYILGRYDQVEAHRRLNGFPSNETIITNITSKEGNYYIYKKYACNCYKMTLLH